MSTQAGNVLTSSHSTATIGRREGIWTSGLSVVFGKGDGAVQALDDINVDVPPGQWISIIGPSGCGKSTLLRVLGDIIPNPTGEVWIGGMTPNDARRERVFSFVFQNSVMLPWRTLVENVELGMEISHVRKKERRQRAREMIDLVGLGGFEDKYPSQLSGGMRQRGAIARALTSSPSFLLMDEPFGALDEINRERLNFELLRILAATKATLVVVTHSILEAVILSDRVLVMTNRPGRISQIIDIDLPRERNRELRDDPTFKRYEDDVRHALYNS